MQFGLFHIPNDLTRKLSYSTLVKELRELAAICDDGNIDVLWLAEHHFSLWGRELSPNPILLAADLAARTSRLKFGLSAAIITFWHPLRLAEDLAVLDHLTDGRLIIGVGRGNYGLEATNLNPDADPNNPPQNFAVFDETLQILKKALSEERFSHKGEFYQYPRPGFSADMAHTIDDPSYTDPETGELAKLTILPRPLQQPHPPMWIVVNSDLSIQHAAENDCGIIMWRPPVKMLKARLRHYQESYEATHGRSIAPGANTAVDRDIFVAETEAEARLVAEGPLMGSLNFSNWRGPYIYLDPGEELDPDVEAALKKELTYDFVRDRSIIVGSVDQVVEKLVELHVETRIEQVSIRCSWPGIAHDDVVRCLTLMTNEVIPRVKQRIADLEVTAAAD